MARSSIEWTEDTWNPLAGCKEVSPGCIKCYAAVMAHRLAAMGQKKYQGTTKKLANGKVVWTSKINLDESALSIPLKRKKPTTYFVNSMSDLFHEDVPVEFIDKVFAVMALCPQHTFQVLTKRAERLESYTDDPIRRSFLVFKEADKFDVLKPESWYLGPTINYPPWPLENVWLGVSVENQKYADERIPHLLRTPSAVRFLSCEPLLGPVDLTDVGLYEGSCLANHPCVSGEPGVGVNWVIVGGESGHGARPFDLAQARSIIEQCKDACVACFVKQLGGNPIVPYYLDENSLRDWAMDHAAKVRWPDGAEHDEGFQPPPGSYIEVKLKDKKGGDPSEWAEDLRVREMPTKEAMQE